MFLKKQPVLLNFKHTNSMKEDHEQAILYFNESETAKVSATNYLRSC